jgi:ABC-type sugar transport system permease subunit
MTEGGPGMATTLFSLYTHRQAFGYMKVGMSSAMAIFLSWFPSPSPLPWCART